LEAAVGDWWLGNDNEWHYDQNASKPDPTVTAMLPAVQPTQDDLSHLDESTGELVNTEKSGPLDEVLVQPPQDPSWRPPGDAA
jgi:hypothetical protein